MKQYLPRKILDKSKKLIKNSIITGYFYYLSCLGLNLVVTLPLENTISINRAKEIVKSEGEKFYLKNKEIEYVPLSENQLSSSGSSVLACTYPSENKFYILQDKDWIYKKPLLHELGHIILTNKRKEKISVDDALSYIQKKSEESSLEKNIKAYSYLLSPEEFFCNIYALIKSIEY